MGYVSYVYLVYDVIIIIIMIIMIIMIIIIIIYIYISEWAMYGISHYYKVIVLWHCWMGDRMGMPLCKDPTPPLYGPFSGTTWVSQCQKRTSELYGARKINRGRHTDQPAGRHSIWTNQCPPPPSSALTLLVGQQEGIRPVKMGGW